MTQIKEDWQYMMILEKGKSYNKLNMAVIKRHVENLRCLDDNGNLVLCGVSKGFKGVAGIIVFKANSFEEAEELCKQEPLVAEGYATYKLSSLQIANRKNNYLL